MDKDIEEIKRRAGLQEETFTVGSQEQLDAVLDEELAQYATILRALGTIRAQLTSNPLNPRKSARDIHILMSKIAQQYQKLDSARVKTRR